MKYFLGDVLKLVSGKSITEMWPDSQDAIEWLNKRRNSVMHAGRSAERYEAGTALFIVATTLRTLERNGLLKTGFETNLLQYLSYVAETQPEHPRWLQSGKAQLQL